MLLFALHSKAVRLRLAGREIDWMMRRKKVNFIIQDWYGRTGNNIQQLIVAIAHAERFQGCISVSPEEIEASPLQGILSPFTLDFSANPAAEPTATFSSSFFHYTELSYNRNNTKRFSYMDWPYREWQLPRRDSILGRSYIEANAHRIAQEYLMPLLKKPDQPRQDTIPLENYLVIHLRLGDISGFNNRLYMTNPIYYYQRLAEQYKRAVIVTEPGVEHPLVSQVAALFLEHEVVSGDVGSDFETLYNATHLASSGVGTFVIASALLSTQLKIFHCSDLYLTEHLNPAMIQSESKRVILDALPGFAKAWMDAEDRLSLLSTYQPK